MRRGINGRLDTIQAAVLLSKLDIFKSEIMSRQRVTDQYSCLLSDLVKNQLVIAPKIKPMNRSSWAQYTIRLSDRSLVQAKLVERGIHGEIVPSLANYYF